MEKRLKHISKLKITGFLSVFCLIGNIYVLNAQIGYQKDSLQIKVYAEYQYVNQQLKAIEITRIFCDYCSESQLEKIKKEASRLAYLSRHRNKPSKSNETKKLAMYIRVSKKDFAAIKQQEINN